LGKEEEKGGEKQIAAVQCLKSLTMWVH